MKTTRHHVAMGLPVGQPTKNFQHNSPNELRYRIGLHDSGIEMLCQSPLISRQERSKHKEQYWNTDDSSLVMSNKWCKLIVDRNDRTEVRYKEVTNCPQTIEYNLTVASHFSDVEELIDLRLKPLTIMDVESVILDSQLGFSVRIDYATFEDGDPHCICSLEGIENIPSDLYQELQAHCISPIRNKICEYLFRYKPELYQILVDRQYVEEIYETSVLDSQWNDLQSHPELDLIIARIEGRNPEGIDPWEEHFEL